MRRHVRWSLREGGVHIILLCSFLVLMLPVIVTLSTSFKHYDAIFTFPPRLIPALPTLANYVTVWFGDYQFRLPFLNSAIISVTTAVVTVLLAFPASYALSRFRFAGSKLLLFCALVTQMFSPIVLVVGLYQTVRAFHLLNTLTGIIITNCAFTLPMAVWLLTGYLHGIPKQLDEAASIDGCSRLRSLRRIILPLASPGVAMTAIYAFIWAWSELLIPLVFINNSNLRPIGLALTDFVGRNQIYWNEMMAASVIATAPVAVLFSFVQRLFVKGFIAGAVK